LVILRERASHVVALSPHSARSAGSAENAVHVPVKFKRLLLPVEVHSGVPRLRVFGAPVVTVPSWNSDWLPSVMT
jgi:hypothetical protein